MQLPQAKLAGLPGLRVAIAAVVALSGLLNVLTLGGSFFMLLVYDRVLPSRSEPTLLGLLVLIVTIYVFQALLEIVRNRMLVEIGALADAHISADVFKAAEETQLRGRGGDPLQPIRDLDVVRGFVASAAPLALFDCPWIFVYLTVCFAFHWMIGVTVLVAAAILIGLTLLTESLTRAPTERATLLSSRRMVLASSCAQNVETVRALGLGGRMQAAWASLNDEYLEGQRSAARLAGGLSSFTRAFRMFLQSAVLALGAYLVIEGKASGGVIIASSILTSRALAPVEMAIANWKGFVAARQAWARTTALLTAVGTPKPRTALPAPTRSLTLEAVSVAPPGGSRMTITDLSMQLTAGAGLGVIGPSGGGKSSLARAIVGAWPIQRGAIRIDGAALDQWDPDQLGAHIGYVSQSVELMPGTVAQNIGRFDPAATAEEIIAAAKAADVHDLILRLPEGYETAVGANGAALSGGQRQRIALARALFRDPFLIVLDEASSNLDSDGEAALAKAVRAARERGAIVILVAHRPTTLEPVDHVLVLAEGRIQALGPKAEILSTPTLGVQASAPQAGASKRTAQAFRSGGPALALGRPVGDRT